MFCAEWEGGERRGGCGRDEGGRVGVGGMSEEGWVGAGCSAKPVS